MNLRSILTALTFLFITVTSTQAQTQPQRIKQGVKSGELTKHETKTLVKKEVATRQDVKAAKADGVVTPAERKDIKQQKRSNSKAIDRKKHNARVGS